MEEEYTKLKPGDLKLQALWNGQLINDGDYWLPDVNNPSATNCYPVKITNIGIVYCRKIGGNSASIRVDGVNYYSDWEDENIATEGITILMPSA